MQKLFGQSSDSRDRNKEQYDRLCAEYQRSRDELRRAQEDNRRLIQNNRELDADRNRYKENATAISNELRNVQRELEDYRTLSEIRGKELVGAQVFLTKADQLSSSELSQKVNGLNEETFQAAAWLADSLHHVQSQWKSEEERQEAYKVTCMIVGEPAARLLVAHASEPEPNFYLVQLVMQIFFANFCSIKIERWYEGGSEVNNFLGTLYGEIRRNEEQAVSGRWRAITHAHIRSSPDEWTRETTNKLSQIMEIASWHVPADKRSSFEQKLKPIFKAILDIRIALGEHFTSADIEIFCPAPGATFEPQNMEDALDDGRGKGKDTGTGAGSFGAILGTAGLGLREVASRGTRSGSDEYRTVLAPKVIPQATLNEVLQPAPPKAKKSKSSPNAG
ncbi:hypothetical protein BDN70DRAFT_811569 [Pholiota conissans]|uniref:Uncharacterized protein n=1 Tax=Pholiota conissans TaxID=109636 RepID=A0A9P5YX97_9AGAR|nr:hypothetical protein BDN70DRAFT_811569 [Pholiota conissans]